jgi:hypothetical protein
MTQYLYVQIAPLTLKFKKNVNPCVLGKLCADLNIELRSSETPLLAVLFLSVRPPDCQAGIVVKFCIRDSY